MLKEMIEKDFGKDKDLNCAEKILYGANEAYNLGLDRDSLRLASGFGGGMAIESTCGALTAAVMVLSKLFVEDTAHKSSKIKALTKEFFEDYEKAMGNIDCKSLKKRHRTLLSGCDVVIAKAAEILDEIVRRELKIN